MGAACGWCVGFGFRSLVVSSSVRDPRCWFLVCWCCFGCVGSACPACVALCCSALPCVRFVCSGRDELIVLKVAHRLRTIINPTHPDRHTQNERKATRNNARQRTQGKQHQSRKYHTNEPKTNSRISRAQLVVHCTAVHTVLYSR